MSSFQIYYVYNHRTIQKVAKYGVNLDISVQRGDKTIDEVYNEIKSDKNFCREEVSISYNHFLGIITNNITLYAVLDDKITGVLSFEFNIKDGKNVIMFEGICSPKIYTGQGIGQELINTLIRIGKDNNFRATRILNADLVNPYILLMFFFLYIFFCLFYFYSNLYYKHK